MDLIGVIVAVRRVDPKPRLHAVGAALGVRPGPLPVGLGQAAQERQRGLARAPLVLTGTRVELFIDDLGESGLDAAYPAAYRLISCARSPASIGDLRSGCAEC